MAAHRHRKLSNNKVSCDLAESQPAAGSRFNDQRSAPRSYLNLIFVSLNKLLDFYTGTFEQEVCSTAENRAAGQQ